MAPFNLGGHMIRSVTLDRTTWAQVPAKFEAGTQPIAEAVGFGAAVDYLTAIGLDAIEEHERALAAQAVERLAGGPPAHPSAAPPRTPVGVGPGHTPMGRPP